MKINFWLYGKLVFNVYLILTEFQAVFWNNDFVINFCVNFLAIKMSIFQQTALQYQSATDQVVRHAFV